VRGFGGALGFQITDAIATTTGIKFLNTESTVPFCGVSCAKGISGEPGDPFGIKLNTATNGQRIASAINLASIPFALGTGTGGRIVAGEISSARTVELFRAVSPAEFDDIIRIGGFRAVAGGGSLAGKQFGLKLDEVLIFADKFPDVAAVVRARFPASTFNQLDFSRTIDPFIFRSGVATAQPGTQLDLLNRTILLLDQAF
jgi:hypothetical protein